MNNRKILIIGGGLAGLSAAVFIKEADRNNIADISLFESSPKLGGRTYSFKDSDTGIMLDNGQHILAGWYEKTIEYLKFIKSETLISHQKSLKINYVSSYNKKYLLQFSQAIYPFNILMGLIRFKGSNFRDLKSLWGIKQLLKSKSSTADNVKELLEKTNQTENLIKFFWEPLILAAFNTTPENVSGELFSNLLKEGLKTGGFNLIIPRTDLNRVFISPAAAYLDAKNVKVHTSTKIRQLNLKNDVIKSVSNESGEEISADYVILAANFNSAAKLLNKSIDLQASTIVSVHIYFKYDISIEIEPGTHGMTGLIDMIPQWMFVKSPRHITFIISAADEIKHNHIPVSELDKAAIFEIIVKETSVILGYKESDISNYTVIKEKRATLIPDKKSHKYRFNTETEYKNLFLAGDWTNTGLPSTIEGAIRSGYNAAEKVISSIYPAEN